MDGIRIGPMYVNPSLAPKRLNNRFRIPQALDAFGEEHLPQMSDPILGKGLMSTTPIRRSCQGL